MFLRASTNNRADTMFNAFRSAIVEFGLPSRVRMDKGGENVLVAQYILEHPDRGLGRGSAITGRSVHIQRIERLWRDLYLQGVSRSSTISSTFWRNMDFCILKMNWMFTLYTTHLWL